MDNANNTTLTATCHCKAVSLTFPTPTEPLNECQCSICRRYGALWAYYRMDEVQVRIQGPTTEEAYIWGDRDLEFRRCQKCGCVMRWVPTDSSHPRVGVNCRMLERGDLEKLETEKSEGP